MSSFYNKKIFILLLFILFISGCQSLVIFSPQGEIAAHEKTLIIIAASLMLIVVLPAIFCTFLFAWKYRASRQESYYTEKWNSKKLEIFVWVIPIIIVSVLAILTWLGSHKLDPFRPIESSNKPLVIQVISLNWKWLFIYPEQQIASVNLMVIPIDVPIHFKLTSYTVMNSFFIPQLGSQIMTMPHKQTQLFLIANATGIYHGISSNFSGSGFTGMTFKVIASSANEFNQWVNHVKAVENPMDKNRFIMLANPSINHEIELFSSVTPDLFFDIINNPSY